MKASLCAVALLTIGAAPPHQAEPVVRFADPNSLEKVIQFGLPDRGVLKRGEIWWRADVDLPPHVSLDRVQVMGYDPVFLFLNDRRCFKIDLDGDIRKLTKAQIDQVDCPAKSHSQSPWPAPAPRRGMRYVGRGWDLDAWLDTRTGKTVLIQAGHQDRQPLLTSSMRVIGLGALGAPDAPMTEVTLVGYIGRQLTLATVMLYYPG